MLPSLRLHALLISLYFISVQISCNICSKKVKVTKAVNFGAQDYCDPCFRRQFLLRSAIEHFMVYNYNNDVLIIKAKGPNMNIIQYL